MEATFAVVVRDQDDRPVIDAGVILNVGQSGHTNRDGYVAFQVTVPEWIQYSVHKDGYETDEAPVVQVTANTQVAYIARRLTPAPSPLSRLHIERDRFVDEEGHDFIYAAATNFLLFQRFLEGENIEPLLYPGANTYRTTAVMSHVPNVAGLKALRPENYPLYWDRMDAFPDYLLARGKRLELTLWCDIQLMGQDRAWLQRHLDQSAEILRTKSNVMLELVNEFPKNGVNPLDFERPTGVLCSRGSGLSDAPPARPGWDYHTFHGRRDWPKVTSSTEDMWYMGACKKDGWNSDNPKYLPPRPIIHDEPIGFAEIAIPGKRSTDPRLAAQLALTSRILGAGGTFHSEDGIFSRPLGPVQQVCAAAFFEALSTP